MKNAPRLLLLASALLLSGCSLSLGSNSVSSQGSPLSGTGSDTSGTATSDSNESVREESSISIEDSNNHDSDLSEDISSDLGSENEFDSSEVPDESIEVPEGYDAFENNTISAAGNYYLKGDYGPISITAPKGSEVYVFLDGASVSSSEGIAFGSSKQIALHVVLLNDSVNSIVNDYEDANAFHVKGNVYISGSGTLDIESKQKNGLKVSKDLYVYEGVTLNVEGYNHAIAARSISANGATISVKTQTKDGIQLECDSDVTEFTKEQGFAYLIDTNFSADTYGDGIQADTFVYISGGTYDIVTHGEFVAYSASALTEYGLTTDDFKYVKSGNSYKRVAKDEIRRLSSSYYALKNSVKGIKAGAIEYDSDGDDVDDATVTSGEYEIHIAHLASLSIDSTDDCIHANYGSVVIDSANLELTTFDDGVHADYDLSINNASIGINNSYEGLEGANVTIDGENTNIVAVSQDDGINAASDLTSTHNITINNGYLRVYASGDGLDANAALYLNGGTVIVEGPGSGNGSLDAEQVFFKGATVFATSTSGMTERMSATQPTFVWQGSSIASGSKVSIVDTDNVALFSYTLKQSCNQVIFSHPNMKTGQTYRLVSGSNVLASIAMNSTLVTSGTSQGGGPGGGGPGGPGWR